MMQQTLPPCNQIWSHSTCCIDKMRYAVSDERISAIEADILMGYENVPDGTTNQNATNCLVPIMAHPPDRESGLSFERFIDLACEANGLKKHLKLDFKEIEAVAPCFDILSNRKILSRGKTIWLNADIIPGPGRNKEDIEVPPNEFLTQCLNIIARERQVC